MKNEKYELTVSSNSMIVTTAECEIRIPLDFAFSKLKPAFARERLREQWEEAEIPEERIKTLLTEQTVERWIRALENNECILECIRLSADLIAEEAEKTGG